MNPGFRIPASLGSICEQGSAHTEILPATPCHQALALWFDRHKSYIRGGTARTYRQYVETLSRFFQAKPLDEIDITEVRAYQEWRSRSCVATRVNAELSNLQMTMREADLWDKRIAPLYRPLPVPKTKVRQNMSEEEERRLLAVAFDKPKRRLAGHCLIVMANTSMGFGELRHLRRCDVFLNEDMPFVEVNAGAKNDYRMRSIPLNFLALRSVRWIVKRWEELGGSEADQYILPHRARRTRDEQARPGHKPTSPPLFYEPMGHIYRAARGILKDAALSHLDPYDMRSHAITKLLSDPSVSDQMYTEIVGHVGDAMKRRYSKQRMEKKRVAMDTLCAQFQDADRGSPKLVVFSGGKRPGEMAPKPKRRPASTHKEQPAEFRRSAKADQRPPERVPSLTRPPQSGPSALTLAGGFFLTSSTR